MQSNLEFQLTLIRLRVIQLHIQEVVMLRVWETLKDFKGLVFNAISP
jgi:hypothetical protein